jgi:hypothetical protein
MTSGKKQLRTDEMKAKIKYLFRLIKEWMKGIFTKKSILELPVETPVIHKKRGRGEFFKNNRKRTKGRNMQYIEMADGSTRLIRHEAL